MTDDAGQIIDTFDWTVDFRGLLNVLANALYTESDVFVRELLQNAHDAIAVRRRTEPHHGGRIDIVLTPNARTVSVIDNGIGMDLADMRSFLAVIGATNKADFRDSIARVGRAASTDLIGQFGIGLLAAFVAGEKVSLTTLKLGSTQALRWRNDGTTTCVVEPANQRDVGTRVDVTIRPDATFDFLLNTSSIERVIKRYTDFLPVPIFLGHGAQPANRIALPWDNAPEPGESVDAVKSRYFEFIRERYSDIPLEVIEIDLPAPVRARGLLYISDDRIPDIQNAGDMEVMVKRVCITPRDPDFLPPWARFVSGIIESPDLNPNAARDGVIRDDRFKHLQSQLADVIVRRLKDIAKREPHRFASIAEYHHRNLVGMALSHDDFFEQVKDIIPFVTNRGMSAATSRDIELRQDRLMSLQEYRDTVGRDPNSDLKAPLLFTASGGEFNQFNQIAHARDVLILNTPREFEREFLRKYADSSRNQVELIQLDNTISDRLFEPLSADEREDIAPLLGDIYADLRKLGITVNVEARKFLPKTLPTALIGDFAEDDEIRRDHVGHLFTVATGSEVDIVSSIAHRQEQARKRRLTLVVNASSPLISRLSALPRRDRDRVDSLLVLYNSAFLASEHLLTPRNTAIIHAQFLGFVDRVLEKREEMEKMRAELVTSREQLAVKLRDEPSVRRDHTQLFMMTPFDESYRHVEEAVREVFEMPPYFFEVRLARDYREALILHENLERHIRDADGFIAEISELNANVLLELGATLLSGNKKPKFCIRARDVDARVPIDLSHVVRLEYESLKDPAEKIAAAIRDALPGRDVDELVAQRRARFVSGNFLRKYVADVNWTDEKVRAVQAEFNTLEALMAASDADVGRAAGGRAGHSASLGNIIKSSLQVM